MISFFFIGGERRIIPWEVRKQFDLKPGQKVVFIPHKKSLRMVIVSPIEEAEGFLEGMDSDFQREEEEEAR
jgi:bifunctional DNA-binding transcriptional regulator/antitoxin component of YhaV-PrlF toxin-antitoxin module